MARGSIISTAVILASTTTAVHAFSSAHHISPSAPITPQHIDGAATTKTITALRESSRPDATDAIKDALRMTEQHGPTSTEAAIAWDIVEEIDSADNTPAIYGTPSTLPSAAIDASQDYYDHISYLSYLLRDAMWEFVQIKQLVKKIKDLELEDPNLAKLRDDDSGFSAALKKALADAKAAADVHGPKSPEAMSAWAKLDSCFGTNDDGVLDFKEECSIDDDGDGDDEPSNRYSAAALKAHHMYEAAIDTALLDETLSAIGMLKRLTKFVNLEKGRLDRELGGGCAGMAGGRIAELQQLLDGGDGTERLY
mmetsp:Transcript_25251/g.53361  ORF Transcript_25251/g.53361 Transcript_25251/m.53361 type:complete len:310 (-) Transcript_25251:64-993(-)